MLTIREVSHFFGRRPALRRISCEVSSGQMVALVGRNGGGKTTLLRAVAGLTRPSEGRIEWRGIEMARISARVRARQVAYVAQNPGLSIDLSVREMVSLGAATRRREGGLDGLVQKVIEEIGLGALHDRPYHELSAGERQRCVVARALAQHEARGLLALDEPLSNLDPGETMRVVGILKARARDGALVVLAMHDLPLVDKVADQVLWLEGGELVANGTPASVFTPERLAQTFHCDFVRGPQGLSLGR
ncbi:MAG: ABC transporter ATP-binding protein [Phycisphaerales bacterium]|nr:ABC transporter ATP-binding protein [Phycisphaerales bacterium]